MTPGEALRALHAAGKNRSPWLPGMVVYASGCPLAASTTRITHVHGPSHEGWVDTQHGPRLFTSCPEGRYFEPVAGVRRWRTGARHDLWEPFLDRPTEDPATVGCLAALAREASGDPGLSAQAPTDPHGGNWYILVPSEGAWATDSGAPTEGEAWAAFLIALAGGAR